MAARHVDDATVIEGLTELFRGGGFAGTSLADIAAATGLQKSSLYHRFPGGKAQMAADVAAAVERQFAGEVLAPLAGDEPAEVRLRAVGARLRAFYADGTRSCLLDVLSIGSPGPDAAAGLAAAAAGWIAAFAAVAAAAGADAATATARAQDAIAGIEGGLVLARATGDRRPFDRAVDRIADTLLDTGLHTGLGTRPDTKAGTQPDSGPGTQADTGAGIQPDAGPDTGPGTQPDTGPGTQPDADAGAQPNTRLDHESDHR